MNDLADRLFAYEAGELETEEDVIDLFQDLIDNGWAWILQGRIGRQAMEYVEAGVCTLPSPFQVVDA